MAGRRQWIVNLKITRMITTVNTILNIDIMP